MLTNIELLSLKRAHLRRLANTNGAAGEIATLAANSHFIARPKGAGLIVLMDALKESGIKIRKTSFDAVAIPDGTQVDFSDHASVRAALPSMTFIEIKTANQKRVQDDFSGFFFAFTEGEIMAAEALGDRHRVMLINRATGGMLLTSVAAILARARLINWQVSVQL